MHANDKKDYEETAECLRDCICLCDGASPEKKERVDVDMAPDRTARARQLSQVFDEVKDTAVKLLRRMESCELGNSSGVQDPVRSPWYVYARAMLVPIFGDIPADKMERRLASGGATCDCCGVARDSTDLKRMLVCGKCNMAYYCSKECQVEQWKRRGHKEACRKPREFRAEDIVRCFLAGLRYNAVLRLKRLVEGEDVDGPPKWEAQCCTRDGELMSMLVEESKLNHIRPAVFESPLHSSKSDRVFFDATSCNGGLKLVSFHRRWVLDETGNIRT